MHALLSRGGLYSFEVNFAYVEEGEQKNALVKLRCCPECAYMLNYKSIKRKERKDAKLERKRRKVASRLSYTERTAARMRGAPSRVSVGACRRRRGGAERGSESVMTACPFPLTRPHLPVPTYPFPLTRSRLPVPTYPFPLKPVPA